MDSSDNLVLAWYTKRAIEESASNCSVRQHLIGELSRISDKLGSVEPIDYPPQTQAGAWVHS